MTVSNHLKLENSHPSHRDMTVEGIQVENKKLCECGICGLEELLCSKCYARE